MTTDPALSSNATPFRVLFGRDARTKIDKMIQPGRIGVPRRACQFRGGQTSSFRGRKGRPGEAAERHGQDRNASNARIGRGSPGRHAKVGVLVMVNRAEDEVKDSLNAYSAGHVSCTVGGVPGGGL